MKKEKVKKEKKSLRQKLADKLVVRMRPYVQTYVDNHDKWLIDKICHRIEFLSLQDNYTIEMIIQDIKSGGYLNDKEKCNESN